MAVNLEFTFKAHYCSKKAGLVYLLVDIVIAILPLKG